MARRTKDKNIDRERWFMDAEGTVWINRKLARKNPITTAEVEAMQRAAEEYAARGGDKVN